MPTAGTHITILQRLAAGDPGRRALLGDPLADDTSPEGRKARFANLGAVGPDVFYAMADYGRDLQDLENFLIKIAGTFQCIGELSEKLNRYVSGVESVITFGVSDSLHETFDLISAVVKEGLLALVVNTGVNLWPVFEPARQKDQPREGWFWADYLHYMRSGCFAKKLIENARATGNDNLIAYAFGYLTHYVTDVVGHPYVNQVVQAPWRLYWQRHHLVENFIDTYIWDRWHVQRPGPPPPTTEEQPLDAVTLAPNVTGSGAPFTYSRLHDHIGIGNSGLGDPVDGLVQAVCDAIDQGLFDIGIAENTEGAEPSDADFAAWTELIAQTLRDVYTDNRHPENLGGDGFPKTDDIAAAYGAFRLVLKMSTEEKIQEPQPPNIVDDISQALQQFYDDLQNNLSSFPPPPIPSTDGSFSWDALWDAIKDAAEWLADVAAAVAKTVFDFIKDIINIAGTAVGDLIKYLLYFLNKMLFALYRSFRDVLVLAAYAAPFTEELAVNMGGPFSTMSLWRSMGDLPAGQYPPEEVLSEREKLFSSYAPFVPPTVLTHLVEQPAVAHTAPYRPTFGFSSTRAGSAVPTIPDDFIDAPLGPDDMFRCEGPASASKTDDPRAPQTFDSLRRNFGGAIANCIRGIQLAQNGFPQPFTLPDYNLDGDRGYAWPTWDVEPAVGKGVDPSTTPAAIGDPLRPDAPQNAGDGVAHVNASRAPGCKGKRC